MTDLLLEAPVRASVTAELMRDRVVQRVASSSNPVLVIVVAAAIVLGLGFIAYLTAVCIGNGYRGFGGVVNVNWNGAINATVKFYCTR
ncbi:hypothetical protein [Curtobacterium sp. MWU13-2055]|uniref:hypothetical protein n=1 Tax=unclassified Curtobacterium TaxID=257496 RepID=UPI00200F59BF|nr:hypothetical protein [Curtobacterium sp. MWU13-2055]